MAPSTLPRCSTSVDSLRAELPTNIMANRKKASEKSGQPTSDGSNDANKPAALAPEARSSKSDNLFSRLVNKAVQRVSESVDNGRRIGKGIVDNNLVANNSNNSGAVGQSSSAYNFFHWSAL